MECAIVCYALIMFIIVSRSYIQGCPKIDLPVYVRVDVVHFMHKHRFLKEILSKIIVRFGGYSETTSLLLGTKYLKQTQLLSPKLLPEMVAVKCGAGLQQLSSNT
jgi:hypothetical protein